MGYAKVIHKKRREKEKERDEKNGQVSEIFKTMGTQMPARKKKINKIAPVL